ncbi:MAG: dihydroneopterin aldolase [Myxococcales bacterium]|nr:dihydroneopterin aldolase [Myxococcales bacterium]MCB9716620.1 dihydroneopterin aldolase [Myxococcales bacterium]
MARDRIELEGLSVSCVLGVHPHERDVEQPVRVDLSMGLDLVPAGRSASIGDTIDYDRAASKVAALLRFRRYRLLENAAHELAAMLFGVYPGLDELDLRLAKPAALTGRAQAAAIHIHRTRADFPVRRERTRFGEVAILLESREAGLYLLHVAPGHEIPRHHHQVMRELEWLVGGELSRGGKPVPLATPVAWEHGQAHDYRNDGREVATLLCCDVPPFIPEDEIVLEDARR